MFSNDPLQSECLSLVAGLYGAVSHPERFVQSRSACDAWLSRQPVETPAARFLRLQMQRATEARAISTRAGAEVPSSCAVVTLDGQGRVVAAGAEAWPLVGCGSWIDGPLRLPLALRAFAEDVALSPAVPRALRILLDDGSKELAGIVLGVDEVHHALGAMRVITLLLCDMDERRADAAIRRGELRAFKRNGVVAGAPPVSVGLAAERLA
jgi:hypothetical protein